MRNRTKVFALCFLALAARPALADPPPNPHKIDFDRDVRPIFETSCLRCHGPEKPKSHFRLDDRALALQGGSDGIDIIPGTGAKSPLIRYVSGADKEIKMPPEGKAEPLTTNQVALLTQWIDEGATWSKAKFQPELKLALVPEVGFIGVHGDVGRFRELEGMNDGYSAGLDRFSYEEQLNARDKVTVEGRYNSAGQDLGLTLNLKRSDVGFVNAGFEQWRKYYDNIGGFDPAITPPGVASAGSLALDEGRIWVDFGLTLPNWPEIVLGFEEQYRVGNESTLNWSAIAGKNIGAATANVNEHTDIIKLDVTKDLNGWQIEDNARLEFYHQNDTDYQPNGGLVAMTSVQVQDDYRQTQGVNTLTVEKSVSDWWSISGGYYYSHLKGSDSFSETTSSTCDTVPVGYFWHTPQVTVSTESHVFSAGSLFRFAPDLTLSLEAQNEWTHEEGFGTVFLDFGSPPTVPAPMVENANMDTLITMQNASLRYTGIPFTIVSADVRLEQESISEYQQDAGSFTDDVFNRKTDAENRMGDFKAGFDTSPLSWLGLNAQYRYNSSGTIYNQLMDSTPLSGYPAFILGRTIKTDELDAKLVLKPAPWIRTTLNCQVVRTAYSSTTDPVSGGVTPGGPIMDGVYDAHTYAISTAVTPMRRLSLAGTFNFSDSRTSTFDNNALSVVAYKGGVYMISGSATYKLNKSTDLTASYSFARANYGQNSSATAVPLGLDYTSYHATVGVKKVFNPHLSGTLQYAFFNYVEPTSGGLADYTAHGIFSTLAYQW